MHFNDQCDGVGSVFPLENRGFGLKIIYSKKIYIAYILNRFLNNWFTEPVSLKPVVAFTKQNTILKMTKKYKPVANFY